MSQFAIALSGAIVEGGKQVVSVGGNSWTCREKNSLCGIWPGRAFSKDCPLPEELNGSIPSERYCKNDWEIQTYISRDAGDILCGRPRSKREGFQLLFDFFPEKKRVS